MKRLLAILSIGMLAGSWSLFAGGCGGSKTQKIDVAAGEYYSEDDFETLSDGRKNEYCQDLVTEYDKTTQDFDSKKAEVKETEARIASIRQQIVPIEQEVLRLESDIRTLESQIEEVKNLPRAWSVKDGESLSLISSHDQIYNDIDKWWRIFEVNRDKIQDPYYIFPDTVLVIPRDWPVD